MPTYTIFAGVNGAGKTTMYESVYHDKIEKRINTDEMVSKLGSWEDMRLQSQCARKAIELRRFYFSNGISFNQETTLCGGSIVTHIKKSY